MAVEVVLAVVVVVAEEVKFRWATILVDRTLKTLGEAMACTNSST